MKNQRTGGEDPIVAEWLPPASHQGGFDPAMVLQKMLQGFCHPEMVLDLANHAIQQQTSQLPSGAGGRFDKEEEEGDRLHQVLLSPSSDELSVDSVIQLADPEGRDDESVRKVVTNDDPADRLGSLLPTTDLRTGSADDDQKLHQNTTPSTTTTSCTVWHILQIFVSILVGLYLSHATLPPPQQPTARRVVVVGIENNDDLVTTAVLPVVQVVTPSDNIHPAEKDRGSSRRRHIGQRHRRRSP
jgi:hypothetical protein